MSTFDREAMQQLLQDPSIREEIQAMINEINAQNPVDGTEKWNKIFALKAPTIEQLNSIGLSLAEWYRRKLFSDKPANDPNVARMINGLVRADISPFDLQSYSEENFRSVNRIGPEYAKDILDRFKRHMEP